MFSIGVGLKIFWYTLPGKHVYCIQWNSICNEAAVNSELPLHEDCGESSWLLISSNFKFHLCWRVSIDLQ